jgi:hypothetical protein
LSELLLDPLLELELVSETLPPEELPPLSVEPVVEPPPPVVVVVEPSVDVVFAVLWLTVAETIHQSSAIITIPPIYKNSGRPGFFGLPLTLVGLFSVSIIVASSPRTFTCVVKLAKTRFE